MNLSEKQQASMEIVECCHRLWQRGLVANHDGNISFKLDANLFLTTPTSFSKLDVTENDLLLVDAQGQVQEGAHRVFSEFRNHMLIYNARPDIKCVVHGHPVIAGGFAISGVEIGMPAVGEAIVSLGGAIKNVSFEDNLVEVLKISHGFLVPGNGAWAVGQNVKQTYLRLELIEQVAQQHFYAQSLGGIKHVPQSSPSLPTSSVLPSKLKELVEQELAKILESIKH